MLPPCSLRRHGLAVEVCFVHMVVEKGTPSFWSTSTRLTTGLCTHTHASVPTAGTLSAAAFGTGPSTTAVCIAPPLCGQLRAQVQATHTPSPCAPECTRVCACPHQCGCLDRTAVYHRRVDASVPTMASTSPRRTTPFRSFLTSPSNLVGSREARQGACCPGTVRPPDGEAAPCRCSFVAKRRTPWVTFGTVGFFAHGGPHIVVAVADLPGSSAARHSSLEPRVYPHRAVPQRIPPGSRAASHAGSHAGCSWA
jgi:hypothetical protein